MQAPAEPPWELRLTTSPPVHRVQGGSTSTQHPIRATRARPSSYNSLAPSALCVQPTSSRRRYAGALPGLASLDHNRSALAQDCRGACGCNLSHSETSKESAHLVTCVGRPSLSPQELS